MAWTWNGSTTDCSTEITAYDSGSWTMAAKVYARSLGENTQGYIQSASAAGAVITGLPFTPVLLGTPPFGMVLSYTNTGLDFTGIVIDIIDPALVCIVEDQDSDTFAVDMDRLKKLTVEPD